MKPRFESTGILGLGRPSLPGRHGLLVLAAAVLVAAHSLWTWLAHGIAIQPDFDYYTQGGLGLFPSPIGRALGSLGPHWFASMSIVASGVCVYAVARRAERPTLAAWLFAVSPATLQQLSYAGIDPIGFALLLLAFAGIRPMSMAVLAAMTHLTLIPFALLQFARSGTRARWAGIGAVVAIAALGFLFTPYRGIVESNVGSTMLAAFVVGLAVGVLVSLPALLVVRPSRLWLLAVVIGATECALVLHVQPRYLLPAAALAAIGPVRPAVARFAERVWRLGKLRVDARLALPLRGIERVSGKLRPARERA